MKPIGDYQSLNPGEQSNFNPDPNQKIRKKFSHEFRSFAEENNCNMDLTGEMLQKIFAGPKLIDFGIVFIKSVSDKYFHVNTYLIIINLNFNKLGS